MVCQSLINSVAVDERNRVEAAENIGRNLVLCLQFTHFHHMVYQLLMEPVGESAECLDKLRLEVSYILILLNGSLHVLHLQGRVRLVSFGLEQSAAQRRQRVPILLHRIDFGIRNTAKHGGVDVERLGCLARIHVAWNVEVVAVLSYLLTAHLAGEARNILAVAHGVGYLLDVAGTELVLLAFLDKSLACVDDEHVVIITMLLEHHHEGRNACAEEDVGWQTDDGVDVVLLDETGADLLFLAATEQYAVGQHDGEDAVWLQVVELVEQEGIVGLRLRRHAIVFEAGVGLAVFRVPVLGVGWVAHHCIHVERLTYLAAGVDDRPVFCERVGAAGVDVARLDSTHHEVHAGEVVGVLYQLLRIVFHPVLVGDMATYRLTDGNEQRTRT